MTINNARRTLKGKQILARTLINIAMDKNNATAVRLKAIETILDRTEGKATQQIDMVADVSDSSKGLGIDISKLSTEEKAQLEKMLEKVAE